jgi:hypothetical protein
VQPALGCLLDVESVEKLQQQRGGHRAGKPRSENCSSGSYWEKLRKGLHKLFWRLLSHVMPAIDAVAM